MAVVVMLLSFARTMISVVWGLLLLDMIDPKTSSWGGVDERRWLQDMFADGAGFGTWKVFR